MDVKNEDILFIRKLAIAVDSGDVNDVNALLTARRKSTKTSSSKLDRQHQQYNDGWIFSYDVSSLPEFEWRKKMKGSTLIHIAAENGDVAMVKMLVEYWDADPSGQDKYKPGVKDRAQNILTPSELIIKKQQDLGEVLEYINSQIPLHKRSQSGSSHSKANGSVHAGSACSAFLEAAAEGNISKMMDIIKIDHVSINCSDYDKRSACHIAASEGHLHVLKFLVEEYPKVCAPGSKLCDILAHDRWGHTPYNDAIRENNTDCADYLRDHGGGEENDVHTFKDTSPETYKALHARGIAEKWAISVSDFQMEKYPFARGAGGQLYKIRWRGLTCVAKSCGAMATRDKQVSIDLANEISMMATLRHPHLVMFLGACFQITPPILLMEFCEGGTLEEKLVSSMKGDTYTLPMPTRLRYMQELAIGMCFLHCCNPPIVHRDLKPSNVLLSSDDRIKITDFGLSKFIPSKNKTFGDKFTMTGETGSYRFMAPEVFKHEEYNAKVDIYSYALVCYWVVTGCRPFANVSDPVQAVKKAAKENLRPSLKQLDAMPFTAELLKRGWAQDSKQRPEFTEITEILQLDKVKSEYQTRSSWFWFW